MNVTRHRYKISAESCSLKKIRDFCSGALADSGVGASGLLRQVILAVDEVASNIVTHAYPPAPHTRHGATLSGEREFEICLEIEVRNEELVVEFRDRGTPFNPLEIEVLEPVESCSARKKHGYGLPIIRRVMEELRYERSSEGENVLTLVKRLDGED